MGDYLDCRVGMPIRANDGLTHLVKNNRDYTAGEDVLYFFCGAAVPMLDLDLTKTIGKCMCRDCEKAFSDRINEVAAKEYGDVRRGGQ